MTQAATTQTPTPPATPQAPAAPVAGVTFVTPQVLTTKDVAALRESNRILSEQLRSTGDRRRNVLDALRSAPLAGRAGLEQRLGILDARILRLEGEIDANGRMLSSLPASLASTSAEPLGLSSRMADRLAPIAGVFTIFVLAPIAFTIARNMWKRGSMSHPAPASQENTQRLERMEQAIDTIAIEMERVSEGQRFVTRLLSESRAPAGLQQGGADRMAVPAAEKTSAQR